MCLNLIHDDDDNSATVIDFVVFVVLQPPSER